MADFNLGNFISEVTGKGLARDNRYEFIIGSGSADERLPSLFCESVSFPPLSIRTRRQVLTGPAYIRPNNIDYGGDGLSAVFLVDKDMFVKKFFDNWMHSIVKPATFTIYPKENYARKITIKQLDEQENVTYELTLYDAFPITMAPMALSYASQGEFHRLTVTFAYRYWDTTDFSNTNFNIGDEPSITGPDTQTKSWNPEPVATNRTFVENQGGAVTGMLGRRL